jgi:hypothetical protein
MKRYLSFVVALLLVSTVTFAQHTTKKSFTGVKRIKLQSSSGDCEIRKSSGNTI